MSVVDLRPYQREAIQEVRKEWDSGANNALIVLATGGGKTIIFCALGREMRLEGLRRILVLAHRTELVAQAAEKWRRVDPRESVGIYQGDRRELHAEVICASVASCYPDVYREDPCLGCRVLGDPDPEGRQKWKKGKGCESCEQKGVVRTFVRPGRLRELPLDEIDLVVIDEAHHVTRGSLYDQILQAIREKNPHAFMLGVTATPFRADAKGFGWLFDRACFVWSIKKGIEGGYLAPFSPHSRRVELDVDLSTVRVSKASGDFRDDDLGVVMDTDDARREIVKAWINAAGPGAPGAPPAGRLTAAFCPTVAAAEHLCEEFQNAGISAGWICGETEKDEREATLLRFRRGEIRVVVNVGVLTEGWDEPETSCIMIARPTKSRGLYMQIVGRGTRLFGNTIEESIRNGKPDCLVLDCAGASSLGLVSLADLSRDDPVEKEAKKEEAPKPEPEVLLFPEAPRELRINGHSVYTIDLFSGRIQWARLNGARVCVLSPGRAVVVFEHAGYFSAMASGSRAGVEWIVRGVSETEALRAAEVFSMENGTEKWLNPGPWFTKAPATERQRGWLRKLLRGVERLVRTKPGTKPVPLTEAEIDGLSMSLAASWAGYLSARIEWAQGAPLAHGNEAAMAG